MSISLSLSLSQITSSGPTLLLDTASSRVQVALLRPSHPALWETRDDEAGVALFSCVETLLTRASLAIADIAAFAFCDGPGSVLGIRTAAVALRAWRAMDSTRARPIYSYCSLTLLAHHLLATEKEHARNLSLIADARRDTWHHVAIDSTGAISPLRRVPTAQLATQLAAANASLAMPAHFRHWTPLPPNTHIIPYALETMFSLPSLAAHPTLAASPLFTPAPEPDAFLHEEPVYQTWTPQVHQAGKNLKT